MEQLDLFPPTPEEPRVLSVSQLTEAIKNVLETSFPAVWVAGEVSNFARPQSGHCYLTLKDDQAQLRAVIWRSVAARLRFELEDGLDVICRGHLELYGPRGTYQLIIEQIEPRGLGALELAFRQLHEKLSKEGLFDVSRKRRLPAFVRRIAVITSPTGAAIRDFLQVLGRRWRGADVMIVPTRVQGQGAAAEIAAAIASVNRLAPGVDCIVLARGGGSLEDLWAFNEELVVRAIVASRTPIISAIGHEIDVTLSDLAADVRALTPSEAAELVAPAAEELTGRLGQLSRRLTGATRSRLAAAQARLDMAANHATFRRPFHRVHDLSRRLDELQLRASRAVKVYLQRAGQRVASTAAHLESLSPLAVLGRGYSITQRAADGALVRDAADLSVGERIATRFGRGRAISRVEEIAADSDHTTGA